MATRNWAGNVKYSAERILRPGSIDEARRLVAESPRVKPVGTRHSFSDIADTPGVHIDLADIDVPLEIDPMAGTVTLGAAARYGEFAPQLHEAGFALPNLASLPHCTVAGSIATATHGSGLEQQNLAAAVSGVELVTASGELLSFIRAIDTEIFPGVVVGLGALGVLTRVTLDLVDPFELRQDGFDGMPWDAALANWEEIQNSGYSVSLFTRWTGDTTGRFLVKTRLEPGEEYAVPAVLSEVPPVTEPPRSNFTDWGVPGPWHDRLPHFRLDATPSVGDELQSEFFVPREDAVAALSALRGIGAELAEELLVSEVRTVAGDDLWMSPAYDGDRLALHFTWRPHQPEVEALLPLIEDRLAPFGARPHWGKLFAGTQPLGDVYPELERFHQLAACLDPDGKFHTPYLTRHNLVAG